ncbi:MAG: TonB-dependent receptor [Gammaproteobacteria bacterium]|nr:TonB-dependent receptor [Gammaproteobacteria bacterium]
MKKVAAFTALLLSTFSLNSFAAEAYLLLFLDKAPLKGAAVTLNGVPVGVTDERGSAEFEVSAGQNTLTLSDDDIEFPITFSADEGEEVEIQVTFTSAAGDEPAVDIRRFGAGDSDTGFITGRVTDTAGNPLAGASIALAGTAYVATTDADGVYVLEVPRGAYDLSISAPGYDAVSTGGIRVMAGLGVTAGARLPSAGAMGTIAAPQIEEVFVLGVFDPQQDSASVERFATSITNAIDVEQLERFGDSDVASALNRVAGVAVLDDKYATVRGLDGRYISSSLNGLLMPSTDPQRRDVQLDLFPTDIVQGIEIQKSYTPDQLATTTGGSIKIVTKGMPDEQIRKVGGKVAYNTDFTFDEVLKYRGSNDDWLTYDSGLRDLPGGILEATDGGRSLTVCDPRIDPVRCTSELEAAQLGVLFQDDYNVKSKDALPDMDVSAVFADRLPAGNNEWGYYLAGAYDRSTSDRGDAELTDPLDITGGYNRTQETTSLTGYLALGYEYGEANEVLSKTTFLRNAEDTTRVEQGVDNQEGNANEEVILQWVERQFWSQAFTGHNEFLFDSGSHEIDWSIAYSKTERDEPDRRTYAYLNNNLNLSAFERRWSFLDEDSLDFATDYALNLDWGEISTTQVKVGVLWSDKERTVDQYRFGVTPGARGSEVDFGIDQDLETEVLPYFNFALDRVRILPRTADTDSYESQEELQAIYLNTNTDFGENWSFLLGARYEDFTQNLEYPNADTDNSELSYDDWYPAANLTWRPTEALQVRLGYSQTVSYPGLIERSEAQSFDPDTDDPIFGNPDLEVSQIDNLDLRVEYYFDDGGSVSLAVFSKDIDQPVERAVPDASGSSADGITFVNQESAELLGIELDGNFTLLDEDDYIFFVGGNISYIDSEVELSEDSLRLEGESGDGRALQGQSEWLGNVQFGYDHYPTEQKFTLLINYFDDRIFRVARGTNTGPEFEDARMIVDITYEKMFSEQLVLEATIKNLTNEKVAFSQNGRTIESFETGTLIGVGLSYQF